MEDPFWEIESELLDLSAVTVDELRSLAPDTVEPCTRRLLDQVERPRVNAGGTGPPNAARFD